MNGVTRHPTCAVRTLLAADNSDILSSTSILEGDSPRLFDRIHDLETDLVIWKRRLPEALRRWLVELPTDSLPNWHILVSCDELGATIESLLHSTCIPTSAERSALAKDIATLGMLFAAVMDTDAVDLRLEAIGHDACWKFHRDCVPARLVTTYRGPGTEWVHPAEDENALTSQRAYAGPVNRLPDHAVALYKGSRATPQKGIVHRSPAVAGTGIVRLFLCINPPSASHD